MLNSSAGKIMLGLLIFAGGYGSALLSVGMRQVNSAPGQAVELSQIVSKSGTDLLADVPVSWQQKSAPAVSSSMPGGGRSSLQVMDEGFASQSVLLRSVETV